MTRYTRARSSTGTPPYGLWKSPITPFSLSGGIRLRDIQWDSSGNTLVWLENRSGKGVLVCVSVEQADAPRDLTDDLPVRASVGYGGGDFTVAGGSVYFVARTGRIYRQLLQYGLPRPITPAFGNMAAPAISPDHRWLLFVHSYEQADVLAIGDTEGQQWPQRLVQGHDFFMQPRWHPHGQSLAYIAWDHPQMPWDGTTLYLATLRHPESLPADPNNALSPPHLAPSLPAIGDIQALAGSTEIAIFQPEFSPDGRWLAYISDESGWSHICLYDMEKGGHHILTSDDAEHGTPAWLQGMRTYGWSNDSQHLFFVRNEYGFAALYRQHIHSPLAERVTGLEAYTWLEQPAVSPTDDTVAVIASSSTQPARLVLREDDFIPEEGVWIIRRTTTENVEQSVLSEAQPVSWEATDGASIHGLLYVPPTRPEGGQSEEGQTDSAEGEDRPAVPGLAPPSPELPPAIIKIHGGPTSQAVASYQGDIQFFTTRGYVVLVVNYRGSTGYGREYMEELRGNWGVSDVEDAVSGSRYLATQGIADRSRMVIMGGSAGGYTVLETLCRAPGVFKAGICLYGVSNLLTLANDTHKFESRYLDTLLGPLPEASEIYRERSPLFHAHLLTDPVAIFQGTADTVVPRAQSDAIVESLRNRNVPHEYHCYEGEEHGWRNQTTIEQFYKAVEAFLRQYVLFT